VSPEEIANPDDALAEDKRSGSKGLDSAKGMAELSFSNIVLGQVEHFGEEENDIEEEDFLTELNFELIHKIKLITDSKLYN